MRRVSKKRQRMVREESAWRRDELGRRGWRCEARVAELCPNTASQLHHIQARSQGGAVLDPDNVMAVCLYCHDWIERHPKESKSLGWKRSPWKGEFPNE